MPMILRNRRGGQVRGSDQRAALTGGKGDKMSKYVRVYLHGGGTYLVPEKEIATIVEAETDGLPMNETITLDLTVVEMSEEDYNSIPEFSGH